MVTALEAEKKNLHRSFKKGNPYVNIQPLVNKMGELLSLPKIS